MKDPEQVKTVTDNVRVRHYHSGNHTPYRGVLHDVDSDKPSDWREDIRSLLSELPEGTLVEIKVEYKTQEIDETDFWKLLSPHKYGHNKTPV